MSDRLNFSQKCDSVTILVCWKQQQFGLVIHKFEWDSVIKKFVIIYLKSIDQKSLVLIGVMSSLKVF